MRHTTVVELSGERCVGEGEDVTYQHEGQVDLRERDFAADLAGRWTVAEFSARLEALELDRDAPLDQVSRDYRRWAFESAALDLALRQGGLGLADAVGRTAAPVTFVVSLGLGSPPSIAPLRAILERAPATRFKIDFGESWNAATVAELATIQEHVATVDLKAQYRQGDFTGPTPNAELYLALAEALPGAWLEDPPKTGFAADALESHQDRVTWDAVLHRLADVISLPHEPRCINVKPSRFGTVEELCRVLDHCTERGIRCYGGGQFELGPGRLQNQELAALFYPDGANDVAPAAVNEATLPDSFPTSPLAIRSSSPGFGAAGSGG